MKRFTLLGIAAGALLLSACHSLTVDAGEEAVLIQKPWFFGRGGIVKEPVKTGQRWIAPTTTAIRVNVQPRQYLVHLDDFMSFDGVPLDFDALIRLKVLDSVGMISTFGPEWFKNNVEREFINRIRQAVRKHGLNETAIDTRAIDSIDSEVSHAMDHYLASIRIPVKMIDITVGRANPPDAVKHQRIETATEQQRQLTEQQRKLAEDARYAAEKSRAAADNAYRNEMNLSPSQFVMLEAIKMQREVCEAKAGNKCVFVPPSSLININPN